MTFIDFYALKKGDLVVYKGSTSNKKRDKTKHRCEGLILEVDKFVTIEDSYDNKKYAVRLIQPGYPDSTFEMFISKSNLLDRY